jgi:hypothetical protein
MGILIIDENARQTIAQALERAKEQAVPIETFRQAMIDDRADPVNVLTLADRARSKVTIPPRSQHLQLGNYHCAISFEHQPGGLARHLSVSSWRRGKVPHQAVMVLIAKAFGFSGFPPNRASRVWLEEFAPGHHAINVVEMEDAA